MKRAEPEPSENGENGRSRTDVKVGRLMRAGTGWTTPTPGSAAAAAAAAAAGATAATAATPSTTSTGLPRSPPAALLGLPPTPKFRYVLKATPKMAGAIIGAKGATVTRLRQESGATLHASEARGHEQDIEFGGTDEQIATAVRLVKEVLAANNPPHPTDWTLKTLVTFTVPNHVVGAAVIGKGGCHVQGVRDQSGAQVDVAATKDKDGVADGRQTVTITGTFVQVAAAYAALIDNINKFCPPPEGAARTRSAAGGRGQRPQHQQGQPHAAQQTPLPVQPGPQRAAQELDALAVAQAGAQRAQQIAMALAAGASRPPMPIIPSAAHSSAPYAIGAALGAAPAAGIAPGPAAVNPLAPQLWQPPHNGAAAAAPPAQVLFYNPADGSIKPISITAEQATNAVAQHHLHQVMQQQALMQQQAQALALVQAQQLQPPHLAQTQLAQQQQQQQQPQLPSHQQQQQSPQQQAQQQEQHAQPLPSAMPQSSISPQAQSAQQGQQMPEQQQQQQQWMQQAQAWQQVTASGAQPPQQTWLPPQYQQQQPQQAQAPAWPGYPPAAWPPQAPALPTPADPYAAAATAQGYASAASPAGTAPSGYGVPPPRAPSAPPPRPPPSQHQHQRQHW